MKICKRCLQHKSFCDFNRDKSRKDGYHPYCKSCKLRSQHKHTKEEWDKILQSNRELAKQKTEKVCCVCKLTKSIEEFGNKKNYIDGKRFECKKCSCKIRNRHYNKTRINQREKRRLQKLELINLLGGKCLDCNIVPNDNGWPIDCFDFHHTDKNKEAQVSHLLSNGDKALSEAQKCVVLCANCHRKRHFLERKKSLTNETA